MAKTTREDFDYFKKCCQKWIERLGLKGWQVYYFHTDMDDAYARCSSNKLTDRTISLWFCKDWNDAEKKTKAAIDATAKHEILELLVTRARLLATSRYATEEQIYEAFHEIVYILEGCIV